MVLLAPSAQIFRVVRLSEPDINGCNWIARRHGLTNSPEPYAYVPAWHVVTSTSTRFSMRQ